MHAYKTRHLEINTMILLKMCFIFIVLTGLFPGTAGQVYTVTFDPDYSPKATIPADYKARDYSIALGAITSKPLKAYLREDGNIIRYGPLASAMYELQSLDENVKTDPTYNDTWLDTGGGEVCQWGVRGPYPIPRQREYFGFYCGYMALQGRTAEEGEMIVDGLLHRHSSNILPPNKRFWRIMVFLPTGGIAMADSELFEITAPAKYLSITSPPPATVVANSDFNMAVAIHGYDDQVLTVGTDSVLFAELQVAWEKETHVFFDQNEKENLMFYNNVRLSSPDAQVKLATFNTVIRKQLVNGRATFNNLRLLDVYNGVKLNVTVYQASFPWQRRPDVYSDLASKVLFMEQGLSVFYMNTSYAQDPAVVLTDPIDVTPQRATKIQLLNNPHGKQCANCPIQPLLEVQLLDSANRLVTSGPDSELNITCVASGGSEVSLDSQFTTKNGKGTFMGSITKISTQASITFKANSIIGGGALAQAVTTKMDVTDELHFAHFFDLKFSGAGSNVGPHKDAWMHFAREDINNNRYNLLPGRTLVTHSYDTGGDVATTVTEYRKMMAAGKDNPSKRVLGVIGFGSNAMSETLQPLLTDDKMPQISTFEDQYEFGNKVDYPYFNRVCWDMGAMAHSIMLSAKSRNWMKTALLKDTTAEVSKIFYEKAEAFGIEIQEIRIRSLTPAEFDQTGVLAGEMEKLKQAGTTIVWVYVESPLIIKLIREAVHAGVAPMHGYQWIAVSTIAGQLPYGNQHALCQTEPICTVAIRSMHCMGGLFPLQGARSEDWKHILTRHYKRDLMDFYGSVAFFVYIPADHYALSYDAMRLYAEAAHNLVTNQLTLTTENLVAEIRQVSFDGLTGHIALNAKGNRPGYHGFISVVDPRPPELGTTIINTVVLPRTIILESEDSTSQLEILAAAQYPLYLPPYNMVLNPYLIPDTPYLNKRRFNSSTGMELQNGMIVPIPPDMTPPTYFMREEYTPAPFYCVLGCGGRKMDEYDITKYAQGDCVNMNTCLCHDGYFGDTCAEKICQCQNGYCDIPRICICDPGWTGAICDTAICSDPCENGKCTSPDVCTCDTGYVGGACGYSVAVAVILPLLFITGLLVGAFFFVRWFLKRQSLRHALANLDWRVSWEEEVQSGVGAISTISTGHEEIYVKNHVSWKSQKCFAQKFNCATLDINNSEVRLEMVHLKELRHNNLVHFVGACLESPNVALLTEICPKGSLDDLLANDNVRLGWDFKYSLLKDICRGMNHLHHSVLVSHGRLKSTNCLVDNRWTCKIAGFGAPSLRYSGPRTNIEEENTLMVNRTFPIQKSANRRELFWTAPELLHHKTLDAVKSGTQAGDVYSFAIILSEVLTREEPYSGDLSYMTEEDVLVVIRDKNHPDAANAKRKWYESGGDTTKLFRPKVCDSSLPDEYAAKNGLIKLLEQDWSDDPTERLSFKHNLEKLNTIYPVKGELIDNLVNMLEKYSSNLEGIVSERTKELQIEKAKTEQLISQMLPKQVVEDLKHGKPVKPESFECVTIFFSDLVGFTAIAKESTPLQVVDLLNDLYTTFDAILDHYDVYKVETIGDAYMVVSGLPIRNGDLHAGEIASVSLDLLSSVCDFRIRHLPETTLQLRIGMHSGPAVAGVVGLKMPRYCLFGDTVNTASRMESSSMALRIHMSEHTAKILEKLGGYHLDCRGEREVKGKGTMTTYWLQGKDGFTKPLPGLNLALSASKHEFK